MDLGPNEFRLDLLDYIKNNGDLDKIPLGLHAVVAAREERAPWCHLCAEKHQWRR